MGNSTGESGFLNIIKTTRLMLQQRNMNPWKTTFPTSTTSAAGKRIRWALLIEYIGSLLLLIGIAVVLVWVSLQQKRTILVESQQVQTTLARIAEADLVGTIRSSDHVLTELAKLHADAQLVRRAQAPDFWQDFWRRLPESSFLFAADAQGRIIAASESSLLEQMVDTREYFTGPRAYQDSLRVFISSPELVLGRERAIVFSRSVRDARNAWRGVVAVVVPCSKIQQMMAQFRLSETQTVTLADETGALIARVPLPGDEGRSLAINANNSMFALHQRSGLPFSFHEFESEIDGEEKIGAALTVNTNPIQTNQSLIIVVSERAEVVLGPWRRLMNVLWGYLIMGLIAIWFGVISYQRRRDNEGARALIEALLANPTLAVVGVRKNGSFCFFNAAATVLTGYSEQEAMGQNWFELCIPPQGTSGLHELFNRVETSSVTPNEYENHIITRMGEIRVVAWRVSMIHDHKGWMAVGLGVDITEHRQREAELKTQAQIDVLTGVPNRRHFLDLATKALSQARRHGHTLSVLMLDIDHFKLVNDTYGHHTGDRVLKDFANKCSEMLREEDLLGRLGGEEFGVVLPETDGPAALIAAERIRQHFADSSSLLDTGARIQCTVSIGVATLGSPDVTCEGLLQQADHALYAAKHGGRNRVVLEGDAPP
jgi:diguanylate cyclase (GGDEF)-like protein/PAS domain S-box-containing protein